MIGILLVPFVDIFCAQLDLVCPASPFLHRTDDCSFRYFPADAISLYITGVANVTPIFDNRILPIVAARTQRPLTLEAQSRRQLREIARRTIRNVA